MTKVKNYGTSASERYVYEVYMHISKDIDRKSTNCAATLVLLTLFTRFQFPFLPPPPLADLSREAHYYRTKPTVGTLNVINDCLLRRLFLYLWHLKGRGEHPTPSLFHNHNQDAY